MKHARRIVMWMQPPRPPAAAWQQHERESSAVAPRIARHEFRQVDRALPDTRERILHDVATRLALRRIIEVLQLTAAASIPLVMHTPRVDAMRRRRHDL